MALKHLTFPIRAPDREMVPHFCAWAGDATGQPHIFSASPGVSVRRVGVGSYRVEVDGAPNIRGLSLTPLGAPIPHSVFPLGPEDGSRFVAIEIKTFDDGGDPYDISEVGFFVTIWVRNAGR